MASFLIGGNMSEGEKKYFSNVGSNCFSTALANLLVEKGESEEANKVVAKAKTHPFVFPTGTPLPAAARLVSDLTDGDYEGTLFANLRPSPWEDIENWRERIARNYGDLAPEITEVFEEDIRRGRIRPLECDEGLMWHDYPIILLVDGHSILHCFTRIDEKTIINEDGRQKSPGSLLVRGLLAVEKV